MFGFDEARDNYQQTYENNDNKAEFSHELLAGGAAFAGFKAFEDHQRKEGISPPIYLSFTAPATITSILNLLGVACYCQLTFSLLFSSRQARLPPIRQGAPDGFRGRRSRQIGGDQGRGLH